MFAPNGWRRVGTCPSPRPVSARTCPWAAKSPDVLSVAFSSSPARRNRRSLDEWLSIRQFVLPLARATPAFDSPSVGGQTPPALRVEPGGEEPQVARRMALDPPVRPAVGQVDTGVRLALGGRIDPDRAV